ncbi:hypothetical protein O181_031003 [Austropuccinia psidii MF-1]|uniref:Uncharacterized protein n=1 Tax=Austropuccinia psidii MF-1 TaxID=1389203 RepID=A0A9Q3H471_9BASI|nr:hypothetical protein [Austropuccinia psidii MF-1]
MYRIIHLSFLALCLKMTLGQPEIDGLAEKLSDMRVFDFNQGLTSYYDHPNLPQESIFSSPTVKNLDDEIIQISRQLMIKNSGKPRPTSVDIAEMIKGYNKLKDSLVIVIQSREGLKSYSKLRSNPNDVEEILYELTKAFKNIQILVRNHLFSFVGMNTGFTVVGNLAQLQLEMTKQSRKFWKYKSLERPIFVIGNQVPQDLMKDLIVILHSISFHSENELHTLASAREIDFRSIRSEIKVAFEQCIFQFIDFMYAHKISTWKDLKSFFSDFKNILLTTKHLGDLYGKHIYAGLPPKVWIFMPKLEFIMNDWKTKHLHNLLKTFSFEQKAIFSYELLIWCLGDFLANKSILNAEERIIEKVKSYKLFQPGPPITPSVLTEGHSIQPNARMEVARELIQEMLSVIEKPRSRGAEGEFIVVYYILHFAKTYVFSEESKLVMHQIETDERLKLQFELLDAGQRLEASSDKLFDFMFYLGLLNHRKSFMREEVTPANKAIALAQAQQNAKNYLRKHTQLLNYQDRKRDLRSWLRSNNWIAFYSKMATQEILR